MFVGNVDNMKARLVHRHKDVSPEGHIIEMTIWHVPSSVPPCRHQFKYSLVLIVDGERVVGFDNERGKGDHRHIGDREFPYRFVDLGVLIEDFIAEVEQWKREH